MSSSYFSSKEYTCRLCKKSKKANADVENSRIIVCGICLMALSNADDEKLERVIEKVKNDQELAQWLTKRRNTNPRRRNERTKNSRDLVRKETDRMVGPEHWWQWEISTTKPLDEPRLTVY